MKYRAPILALTTLAGLTACQADRADEESSDAPQDEASPTAVETVSILRPDVEAEQEVPLVVLEALDATIGFPDGGAGLDDDAVEALEDLLRSPQIELSGAIELRGHSDAGGNDEVNLRASQARAEAVRDWLVDKGVAEDRFEVIAFGEQNPVEPNARPDGSPNEAGRAANRRVDIHVLVPEERAETPGDPPAGTQANTRAD